MYNNVYNPQASIDRINNQIAELERIKSQIPPMQQPTNLTQNFQIAPNNQNTMRYANSMEEVEKSIVIGDTPFFSNDMSILWVKNAKNEVKTYELKEIIKKDEKDLKIEYLTAKIEELEKERINGNGPIYEYDAEPIKNEEPTSFSAIRKNKKK